jgi:hypothetical protein
VSSPKSPSLLNEPHFQQQRRSYITHCDDECGFIQNGNNVQTVHKNNNNACVRDMQMEHPVNTLGQTVLSSPIG